MRGASVLAGEIERTIREPRGNLSQLLCFVSGRPASCSPWVRAEEGSQEAQNHLAAASGEGALLERPCRVTKDEAVPQTLSHGTFSFHRPREGKSCVQD